jgi:hypothetical protein
LTASTFLNDYLDWPSVGRVFCLQRRSIQLGTGVVQTQITYGLTSLPSDEASPTDLLTFMRDYGVLKMGYIIDATAPC